MLEAQKVSKSEIQAWRNRIENGDLSDVVHKQEIHKPY
jgi:hypothetical protein